MTETIKLRARCPDLRHGHPELSSCCHVCKEWHSKPARDIIVDVLGCEVDHEIEKRCQEYSEFLGGVRVINVKTSDVQSHSLRVDSILQALRITLC